MIVGEQYARKGRILRDWGMSILCHAAFLANLETGGYCQN